MTTPPESLAPIAEAWEATLRRIVRFRMSTSVRGGRRIRKGQEVPMDPAPRKAGVKRPGPRPRKNRHSTSAICDFRTAGTGPSGRRYFVEEDSQPVNRSYMPEVGSHPGRGRDRRSVRHSDSCRGRFGLQFVGQSDSSRGPGDSAGSIAPRKESPWPHCTLRETRSAARFSGAGQIPVFSNSEIRLSQHATW